MNTQEWKEAANLPWQRQRPGASRRSRWGLCCSVESVKTDFTRSGFQIRHLLSVAFQASRGNSDSEFLLKDGSGQRDSSCAPLWKYVLSQAHTVVFASSWPNGPDFKGRAPAPAAQSAQILHHVRILVNNTILLTWPWLRLGFLRLILLLGWIMSCKWWENLDKLYFFTSSHKVYLREILS